MPSSFVKLYKSDAIPWWRVHVLWNHLYKGVEIGRLWIGWTNPEFKKAGW